MLFFFFQAEDGIRDIGVTGVQTCALPIFEVSEQWAIRNPDLYVAGQRVEMVSSADALAEQLSVPPVGAKALSEHPFFRGFWASPDRIGYWVEHPDPPGEDTAAVARRPMNFAMSLPERPGKKTRRYIF